jgi:hypothetical protein
MSRGSPGVINGGVSFATAPFSFVLWEGIKKKFSVGKYPSPSPSPASERGIALKKVAREILLARLGF